MTTNYVVTGTFSEARWWLSFVCKGAFLKTLVEINSQNAPLIIRNYMLRHTQITITVESTTCSFRIRWKMCSVTLFCHVDLANTEVRLNLHDYGIRAQLNYKKRPLELGLMTHKVTKFFLNFWICFPLRYSNPLYDETHITLYWFFTLLRALYSRSFFHLLIKCLALNRNSVSHLIKYPKAVRHFEK